MSRMIARVREVTGERDESGMTLVELLVSMAIFGIVITSVYAVLVSVQNGFSAETDRSINVNQAGLVMQQLAKETQSAEALSICQDTTCSSGNLLAWGQSCTTPTTACYLVVYTQTNASTRQTLLPGPNAPFSCVQWRVSQVAGSSPAKYTFQSRRWQTDWEVNPSSLVTGWRNVSDQLPTLSATFQVPTAFGGRLVQATVTLNNQPTSWNRTSNLSVTRQLTGANIVSTSSTNSGAPNPCIPPNGTVPA